MRKNCEVTRKEFDVLMLITRDCFPSDPREKLETQKQLVEAIWEKAKGDTLVNACFNILTPLFAMRMANDPDFARAFMRQVKNFSEAECEMIAGETIEEVEREAKRRLDEKMKTDPDVIGYRTFSDVLGKPKRKKD